MPIHRPTVDSRLMGNLSTFLNDFCTFSKVTGRGATGGASGTPVAIPELSNLRCRVGRSQGRSSRRREGDSIVRSQAILLAGHINGIQSGMTVTVLSSPDDRYLVTGVAYDGDNQLTQVSVEVTQ